MTASNTAAQWDKLWEHAPNRVRELMYNVSQAEHSVVWRAIRRAMEEYGIRKDSSTIELGAGAGTVSAAFAKQGAHVTVLDYSQAALDTSATVFQSLGLMQASVLADALKLPAEMLGKYDVSLSFGMAEHFEGQDRLIIIKAHFDVLRPGGLAIISVPNLHCWPYRFWKWERELTGRWSFGLELPYTRRELADLCHRLGIRRYRVDGSPFFSSLNFVLPFARWKRSIDKRVLGDRRFDPARVKPERPDRLGPYLGYALFLLAQKPL
ncbi:MAG TPA: class I SAM-dependent methyltransferase [Burkholderiales bacterium]|nr:class I SAM-dependent methyltransferase [Burkholderiales bacterium]